MQTMKCIGFLLLLCCLISKTLGSTTASPGNCSRNTKADRLQFGQDCDYLCRCKSNTIQCNRSTGECQQGGCEQGWMGPACQYVNLAYGKTMNNASDGDDGTCLQVPSLVLDMGNVYPIKEVAVVFTEAGVNTTIRIKDESTGFWESYFTSTWTDSDTVYSVCKTTIEARYINLTTTSPSSICEIKVNGGRNLAYKQETSQTSTAEDAPSPNAVDGTSGDGQWYFQGKPGLTCTHTEAENNPWWRVNLGSLYSIAWFRIYNRLTQYCNVQSTFHCRDRLVNFTLFLSNSSDMVDCVQLYQDSRTTLVGQPDPIEVINIQQGQFVEVKLPGTSRTLTLCEIEVFGDCPNNTCGFTCDDTCYCKDTSYVDKLKGLCFDGCQPGWTGDGYRCDRECSDRQYGPGCSETCGFCKNSNPCDRVNGTCPGGQCATGWMSVKCDQNCTSGSYGQNCSMACGQCKNSNACHHINGSCPGGECLPGWEGITCHQACPKGKYGDNCKNSCGHCKTGAICNPTNGHCPLNECDPGWTGAICKTGCPNGTYGANCDSKCGECKDGSPCDPKTGECSNGCEDGWKPNAKCTVRTDEQTDEQKAASNAPFATIAGGLSAAVVCAICGAIICIICRRRRRRKSEGKGQLSVQRSTHKVKESFYENAEIQDEKSGASKPTSARQTSIPISKREEDQTVYYNVGREKDKLPEGAVLLSDLWDYVQTKLSSMSSIEQEFKTLPSGLIHPSTAAKRPKNIKKNRYKNLYAYDHSRVQLTPDTDDDGDYVNACFVDGFTKPKAFIASQGATQNNMNDIWRMIWQQNCGKIVMLTNLCEHGVTKCEQYWPDDGEKQYGLLIVAIQEYEKFADCVIRTFRISHQSRNRSKIVKHFHYIAWPDKDVPGVASSLVQFWNKVSHTTCPVKGPVLVHCSAGIGRTGTYIALDYLVEQGRKDGYVNFADCIKKIREQRVNLVQTKEQYLFVHEAVVEALMLSGTGIASDQFPKTYMDLQQIDVTKKQPKLFLEFEKLQRDNPFDRERINLADDEDDSVTNVVDEHATAKLPQNFHKNRYSNILAADKYRPCLTNPPEGSTDYVNAVYMPSHRDRSAFIITQMPLPSTVEDFWALVHEEEITTIVMMNIHNQRTSQLESAAYWPEQKEVTFGDFTIEITDSNRDTGFKTKDFRWTRNSTGDTSTLRHFQFLSWPDKAKVPQDRSSILHLFEAIMQWQRQINSGPILVHCMDGAERSGLFCVLSTIIERLNIERDVAVAQTIKKMRIIRQQIIPNYEQFQFCHDVVLEYLKTFDTYSNFA